MSDFSDWLQNNLVDLARLAVQCAILATVVSYGRKLLKTLRASQEQVGALLKLSVSDTAAHAAAETIAQPEPSLEAQTFSSLLPEPLHAEARAPQLMAPSANGVASWLQAPMRRPGVSPWRKVVRWLQAPAGN